MRRTAPCTQHGEEDREVGSKPSYIVGQHGPTNLLLARQLGDIDERAIGDEDVAFKVGDHEPVGRAL